MRRSLHIFTTREAYLLVAAAMFLGLFIGMSLQGLVDNLENPDVWENVVVLVSELLILLPVLLILRQRKISLLSIIPLRSVSPITFLFAGLLVAGTLGLISVFEVLIVPFFPVPDFLKQLEVDLSSGTWIGTAILVLAAVIVAPLVEETLFRGILQQSMFYRFGSLIPALVIPTLVFTLFHVAYLFYLPALIELLVLALLLAWLMVKTGNLLVSIMAHGLFNLSSFLSVFAMNPEEPGSLADLGWTWIVVSTLLVMVAGFYFNRLPVAQFEDVYLIPPLAGMDLNDDQ